VVTIYGIKNCDTMKKARTWLEANGIAYRFHDYKAEGIERAHLEAWADASGWETILNRAGTTFRKLDEAERADLDRDKAIRLMLAQPSLIKRPVLETEAGVAAVGFKPETYTGLFSAR
jgi:Spx/MgsR family transcriptional regulator